MGRIKHYTAELRRIILKMRKEGKSYKFIAQLVLRSETMIANAAKWQINPKKRGRPRKTGDRTNNAVTS